MSPLTVVDGARSVPADANTWLDALPGPVAIRTKGRDSRRIRLVSGMMHGNEPSGLRAIFEALRSGERFETDVVFFVGGVLAARAEPRHSRRMLPGHRDPNRCFRPPFSDDDGRIARALLDLVRDAPLEAVVDLHNNSGRNPVYGVGIGMDAGRLGLTSLFTDCYVASSLSLGALHEAFPESVAAITMECGRSGDRSADVAAIAGLRTFLHTDVLPRLEPAVAERTMRLFRDPVRVRVRPGVSLAYGNSAEADLTLDADVDRHNFRRQPAGTRIGWLREGAPWPFEALDARGTDIACELFERNGDAIVTKKSIVPIMMTTNARIAHEDCLFYVAAEVTPLHEK